MRIRAAEPGDWPAIWAILEPVFRAGETYALPRDIDEPTARRFWFEAPRASSCAEDDAGALLGAYYLKANALGPGGHVANAGFVTAAAAQGRGVARAMCEHAQDEARRLGFRAMQFNSVAASNERAVRLWLACGFDLVGRLPGAFRHPTRGFVDALVMFKTLDGAQDGSTG